MQHPGGVIREQDSLINYLQFLRKEKAWDYSEPVRNRQPLPDVRYSDEPSVF